MIIYIPLKRDSQRVPGKNFREFKGEPLYKRILKRYKDYLVYVDTDYPEVVNKIRKDPELRHVLPFERSSYLKGHEVSVNLLILDFLNKLNIKEEIIAQIHVTSPFLKLETLKKAIELFKKSDNDSLFSVNKIQARCWRLEGDRSIPVNHNPFILEQTQDLSSIYVENSSFYIFTRESFMSNGYNRIGKKPYFYEIGYPENLDIDTEKDWENCSKIDEL